MLQATRASSHSEPWLSYVYLRFDTRAAGCVLSRVLHWERQTGTDLTFNDRFPLLGYFSIHVHMVHAKFWRRKSTTFQAPKSIYSRTCICFPTYQEKMTRNKNNHNSSARKKVEETALEPYQDDNVAFDWNFMWDSSALSCHSYSRVSQYFRNNWRGLG